MTDGAQASLACAIALHVPTSSVQFGPDILEDEIPQTFKATAPQPRRPHPGGLDTLQEASHVNALSKATGPSPTSLQAAIAGLPGSAANSNGLDNILSAAMASLSPPSRSRAITRAKGYNAIVIQLANERWRERWSRLCLAPAEPFVETPSRENTAEAPKLFSMGDPGGMGGSWELLAQANGAAGLGVPLEGTLGQKANGFARMVRSSSRKLLSDASPAAASASPASKLESIAEGTTPSNSTINVPTDANNAQMEAELWRHRPTFHPSEVNLSRFEDSDGVEAIISPWLELDSVDEGIRLDSELALRQELSYASFLGVTQVILPPPSSDPARRQHLIDYARAIAGCLVSRGSEAPAAGHFMRLAIRLPVSSPFLSAQAIIKSGGPRPLSVASNSSNGTAQMRAEDDWSWQVWSVIQSVCAYDSRLSIAIDLSAPLPSSNTVERWQAEPVSHVWLPTRAFLSNAKGYPVLSKAIQSFLRQLILNKAPGLSFVLSGTQSPPENHTRGGQAAYEQYVRHMEKSVLSGLGESDAQIRGYGDYLQAPLQPLFDNLEGQTYATFEADAIKYDKYEEAIAQALISLPSKNAISIWVCGAGRGPLVSRCIAAARRASRTVRIVALEKNPNAAVGLRERAASEWGQDVVRVEVGDMRSVAVPADKADMIVSELLGSFGDNELSPECLDGALRLLKPDGICIPRAYSSYVTPISTPKLHSEIAKGLPMANPLNASQSVADVLLKSAETPYVVLLRAMSQLAARGGREEWSDVQHCWTFDHTVPADVPSCSTTGLPMTNGHNIRLSSHTFHIPRQSICHGLAGYFEAHLWGNVVLSIHPDAARTTAGMQSWFPLYFPFKQPLVLSADSELDVFLWRMTSNDRVWYEWMAQSYVLTSRPLRALSMGMDSQSTFHSKQSSSQTGSTHMQRNGSGSRTEKDTLMVGGNEAFQNAPNTPRLMDGQQLANDLGASYERVLVGMTSLMNPGGRSSSVRM